MFCEFKVTKIVLLGAYSNETFATSLPAMRKKSSLNGLS